MAMVVADAGRWIVQIVKPRDLHPSSFCQSVGSSNGQFAWISATDVWRATTSATPEPSPPSFASP